MQYSRDWRRNRGLATGDGRAAVAETMAVLKDKRPSMCV